MERGLTKNDPKRIIFSDLWSFLTRLNLIKMTKNGSFLRSGHFGQDRAKLAKIGFGYGPESRSWLGLIHLEISSRSGLSRGLG